MNAVNDTLNDPVPDPRADPSGAAVTLITATVAAGNAARLGEEDPEGREVRQPSGDPGEADPTSEPTRQAAPPHGPPAVPPHVASRGAEPGGVTAARSTTALPPLDQALNVVVQALVEGRQDAAAAVRRALRDAALAPYSGRASMGRVAGPPGGRPPARPRGCDVLPTPPLTP